MATGRINQVLSEEKQLNTTNRVNCSQLLTCQTGFEHVLRINSYNHVETRLQELKSGFARATQIKTHTKTFRPTENAQSYWDLIRRCAARFNLRCSFVTQNPLRQACKYKFPNHFNFESTWRIAFQLFTNIETKLEIYLDYSIFTTLLTAAQAGVCRFTPTRNQLKCNRKMSIIAEKIRTESYNRNQPFD